MFAVVGTHQLVLTDSGYIFAGLLAVSLASNIYLTLSFLAVLDRWENRDNSERSKLLQRIQSPVSAVALHAQEELDGVDGTGTFTLPFDDDEAMSEYLAPGASGPEEDLSNG